MYKNLKAELARAGINDTQAAEMLEISRTTLCSRMTGKSSWKLSEMEKIQEELAKKNIECSLDYLFEVRS